MAVTDSVTITELINSEVINDAVLDYAYGEAVSAPYLNWMDLRGRRSATGAFPKWIKDSPTGSLGETATLSNETLETTEQTITAAEVGIRRDISDISVEDGVLGAQIFDAVVMDAGTLLGEDLENDIDALFAGFSTSVGATGTNLSLANMVEAQAQIRTNGMRGQLVYVLHTQQASDYQAAQAAATSTTVNDFFTVEGGIETGFLGRFMGQLVFCTNLVDLVNTNADRNGACFIRGDVSPRGAALGGVMARDVRVREDRSEENRLTKVVSTARWGVGEISDLSGTGIVTDA